jgi:hypothetical protein
MRSVCSKCHGTHYPQCPTILPRGTPRTARALFRKYLAICPDKGEGDCLILACLTLPPTHCRSHYQLVQQQPPLLPQHPRSRQPSTSSAPKQRKHTPRPHQYPSIHWPLMLHWSHALASLSGAWDLRGSMQLSLSPWRNGVGTWTICMILVTDML